MPYESTTQMAEAANEALAPRYSGQRLRDLSASAPERQPGRLEEIAAALHREIGEVEQVARDLHAEICRLDGPAPFPGDAKPNGGTIAKQPGEPSIVDRFAQAYSRVHEVGQALNDLRCRLGGL